MIHNQHADAPPMNHWEADNHQKRQGLLNQTGQIAQPQDIRIRYCSEPL
jgi:hypothetical protein